MTRSTLWPIRACALWLFALASPVLALGSELAPGGALRAAYLAGNAAQAVRDPTTGEAKGIAVDLARELARQQNVPLQLSGVDGVQALIGKLRAGEVDIGFLANGADRRTLVSFSQDYLRNPQGIAVPEASPLRRFDDLKGADTRIGITRSDTIGGYLARVYPSVKLVEIDGTSVADITALVQSGRVDGFAANRLRLGRVLADRSGLRLLTGGEQADTLQAIAVPLGRTAALAIVNRFLDDSRASGFLEAAIQRANNGTVMEPSRP